MGRRIAVLLLVLAGVLPATSGAAPVVQEYDLGPAQLAQQDPAFPVVPVQLQGIVGVPEAAGAAPIVVLLHGRHPICNAAPEGQTEPWPCPPGTERRYDLGFRYLVKALAARGFVALAPNLNAAWTTGAGTPVRDGLGRVDEIVALHLSRLAEAARGRSDAFGTPLQGHVDLTRLVLVGHSGGGQAAMHLARQRRKQPDPAPGSASDGRLPVDAALLVAPTFAPSTTQPQADVPTAVVLPSCDGAVPGLDGAAYYDAARLSARRASIAASVLVRGANHDAFNSTVASDDATLVQTPGCGAADPQRLKPAAQRQFLVDYASAFLDATQRSIVSGGLDAFVQPPAELFGARVVTSLTLPAAQRRVVLEPRSRVNLRRNALGGKVSTAGAASVGYCPPARPCRPGLQQPSYPAQLRLVWQRKGGVLRLRVPPASGDVSAYDLLALRVAVDPTAGENPAGKAQSLSVALVDAGGHRRRVVLPPSQPALQWPSGAFLVEGGPWGHVAPGAVRIPLGLFSGVDLRRVRAVELWADRTPRGALLVQNVELVDLQPPASAATTRGTR